MQKSKLQDFIQGSGLNLEKIVLQNSKQLFGDYHPHLPSNPNPLKSQIESPTFNNRNHNKIKRSSVYSNSNLPLPQGSLVKSSSGSWNKGILKTIWWWSPSQDSLPVEFCQDTSIHGLKFIAKKKSHICERVFWIIAFLFGFIASVWLISDVWARYQANPVIVTFQPRDMDIDSLPFPSVTFCNINKFSRSKVEELKNIARGNAESDKTVKTAQKQLQFVSNLCDSQQSFAREFNYSAKRGDLDLANENFTITEDDQHEMTDFLMSATVPCGEMIHLCMFGENVYDCKKLFSPIITDYGKCCTFNILPYSLLMRDPRNLSLDNPWLPSKKEINLWKKWKYSEGMELKDKSNDSRPWRQSRAGMPYGLSVLVDGNLEEYFCPASDSYGLRFGINSPLELPHISEFASVLELGKEVYVEINPDMVNADDEVRGFTRDKRSCLFASEEKLHYFYPYTGTNCIDECTARLIMKKCNCSFFYMPHEEDINVCNNAKGSRDARCIDSTRVSLLGTLKSNCSQCDNLCEDITYHFQTTTAELQPSSQLWEDPLKAGAIPPWAKNKMSVVHIFFGSDTTVPKLRKRLYGDVDLIASTGGLLGLCLGVSVLSAVEVVYFCIVRTFLNFYKKRQKTKELVKKFISNTRKKQEQSNNIITLNPNQIPLYTSTPGYRTFPPAISINDGLPTQFGYEKWGR